MLKNYPKFKRGQIEEIYKKLKKSERDFIEEYLDYRRARGINSDDKIKDIRRYTIQLRHIIQKEFKKLDLKDLRSLVAIINKQGTKQSRNNLKTDLKRLLKFTFKDWSLRFDDFEDIRLDDNGFNEEKINSQTIIHKNDIDKLIKHETKNFYKAFLLIQYEGGLRTKEVRFLKWTDVKINVDEQLTEVKIYATKTKQARTIFLKEATFYLEKLKEEQENTDSKGEYIFHAPKNLNEPIHKSTINIWFKRLTKRVLGVERWNYILRHSRATELYKLAYEGKISKDVAIKFMGHKEDMSGKYTHLDNKDVKEMLKNQIYKIEDLPEEKRHKLEIEISELKEKMRKQQDITERALKMLEIIQKQNPKLKIT